MESLGDTAADQKMDEFEGGIVGDKNSHIISSHTGEDAPSTESTASGSDSVRETNSSAIPVSEERRRRWRPTKTQKQMLEEAYVIMKRNGSLRHQEVDELTTKLGEHGPVTKKNIRKWLQNRKYMDQKQQQRVDAAQTEASQPLEQNLGNTSEGCSGSRSEETECKKETSEAAGLLEICEDEQGLLYIGRPQKRPPSLFNFQ